MGTLKSLDKEIFTAPVKQPAKRNGAHRCKNFCGRSGNRQVEG